MLMHNFCLLAQVVFTFGQTSTYLTDMKELVANRTADIEGKTRIAQKHIDAFKLPKVWLKYTKKSLSVFLQRTFVNNARQTVSSVLNLLFQQLTFDWLHRLQHKKTYISTFFSTMISPKNRIREVVPHPIAKLESESARLVTEVGISWIFNVDKELGLFLTVVSVYFPGYRIDSCNFGHFFVSTIQEGAKRERKIFLFCNILSNFWLFLAQWTVIVRIEARKLSSFFCNMHYTITDAGTMRTSPLSGQNFIINNVEQSLEQSFTVVHTSCFVMFYHICSEKYMKLRVTVYNHSLILLHHIIDGPDSSFKMLSPKHRRNSDKMEYLTTTFQCMVQISSQTKWRFIDQGKLVQYSGVSQLFADLYLKYQDKVMDIFYPSAKSPLFCMCLVRVSSAPHTFVQMRVKTVHFEVKKSKNCLHGGLSFYEFYGSDLYETEVLCPDLVSSTAQRTFYSRQNSILIIFYSYQKYTSELDVAIEVSVTKCKGVKVNACHFMHNHRFIHDTSGSLFTLREGECKVIHVQYFYHFHRGMDILSCSKILGYKNLHSNRTVVVYNVTGYFMTFLPQLNRSSYSSLLRSECFWGLCILLLTFEGQFTCLTCFSCDICV